MPLTKTKNLFITVLLIDIIIVLIFCGVLWFIRSANEQFSSKAALIGSEIDKQNAFFSMKKDWEENNSKITNLYGYVIPSDGTVDFMKDLEKITLNNGLKSEVKSISFGPVPGGNYQDLELVDIKIDVIGEWKNVEYFMEILENYPSAISIKSFNLSKFTDYEVKGKRISQWLGSFNFTLLKLKETK